MLEELLAGHRCKYDAWLVRIHEGERFGKQLPINVSQFEDPHLCWFAARNSVRVFESGICYYLAQELRPADQPRALSQLPLGCSCPDGHRALPGRRPLRLRAAEIQNTRSTRFMMETKRQLTCWTAGWPESEVPHRSRHSIAIAHQPGTARS